MTDEDDDLIALAAEVGARLVEHARACTEAEVSPAEVASAGDAAVAAVLAFERQLDAQTGWSNPLRHLGALPSYDGPVEHPPATGLANLGKVVATYRLAVVDETGVRHLVEGRGGDAPADVATSLRALIGQDGWDPARYPSGLIEVLGIEVDVTLDGDRPPA